MAPQFIFTMRDLRRFYPPDREVLRGINLSFYPGAKIGIIGSNGSGKSSLLRIMAGDDDGFTGEARLTPGFTVGYLPQEPSLDPGKDVAGNVADGVGEIKALVDRFNEVCAAMADPDADFDALLAEQASLQDKIDAADAWDLERKLEVAADALRLPDWDADVTKLSGGERRRDGDEEDDVDGGHRVAERRVQRRLRPVGVGRRGEEDVEEEDRRQRIGDRAGGGAGPVMQAGERRLPIRL